jgi:hypothetical protein
MLCKSGTWDIAPRAMFVWRESVGCMAVHRTAQRCQRGCNSIIAKTITREAINLCSEKRLLFSIKFVFIIKICFTFLRILKSLRRQHPAPIHKGLQIFLKSINRIFFYRRKFLLTLIIFRIECILRQLIGYSII